MKRRVKDYMCGLICGLVLMLTVSITAAIYYKANEIEFTPTDSSWNATNVEEAINDIKDNYIPKSELLGKIWDFNYTGGRQHFIVPLSGTYKIELWGAQGGNYDSSLFGGNGGYTKGEIYLEKDLKLFVYVGGQPSSSSTNTIGGWNGGGNTPSGKDKDGRAGGGATDVRLVTGEWNDTASLISRIMVAAGGGGAAYETTDTWRSNGGAAGGLNGLKPTSMGTNASARYGTGATQTSGGKDIYSGTSISTGTFGIGGTGYSTDGGSGGGGGYYGGGGSHVCSGGGGGSSFISGHNGCNAIDENGVHTGSANHYSNFVFTNTLIIDGEGYNWNNVRGEKTNMPTYDGKTTMIGNTGNGYAKITLIEID